MESLTLPRRDVLALWRAIQLAQGQPGVKFGYALARTRRAIAAEVETVQEIAAAPPAFQAWERARLELCRAHALCDADGRPVERDGSFVIDEARQDDFDRALADLIAEHGEALAARQAQLAQTEAMLTEPVTVQVHRVALAELPEGLTAGLIDALLPIVAEPE